VGAGQIDRHFLSLYPAHSLSFFDRFLDRIHRRVGIDDHSFSQSPRFGFSDPDDVEQSAFAGFASNTRHPARPYVETDCVLRAPGHLAMLLK